MMRLSSDLFEDCAQVDLGLEWSSGYGSLTLLPTGASLVYRVPFHLPSVAGYRVSCHSWNGHLNTNVLTSCIPEHEVIHIA
jgi:hypothetical protein